MLWIKGIIAIALALVLVSLFSALVMLIRNRGKDRHTGTVKALTWRIGISLTLFVLLMAGFYFGVIPSTGLAPAPGR